MNHTNLFLTCCKDQNEHVALQNFSIYYTWKNIKQQYKNNYLKIIPPTLNHELELPDSSYLQSDVYIGQIN